jgi:hypothetical protein
MTRYIIGFLLAVGLIIIVIILIIHALSGTPQQPLNLNSYVNSGATVQYTIDSPVSAETTHHDIIINVGSAQSSIEVTQGYEGQVVTLNTYPMSTNAYAVFLKALALNGFTNGNNNPALSDERGHCALGDRYIFQVINSNSSNLERYWYSSCGTGTFQGDVSVIQQLFIDQIPDYSTVTANITL